MLNNYQETYDDASILRDWIVFRDTNCLYKGKVRLNIGKWKDLRKKRLIVVLADILNLSMSDARQQINKCYTDLLPRLMDNSYTLIKSDERASIFVKEDIIIKAYPTIIRNLDQNREDLVSRKLYDGGFNVPQRFEVYQTEFYTCYPMEKLPLTLINLLESKESGDHDLVVSIIKTVVPILKVLHTECKQLYVDFSVGNIAFRGDVVYMIDFGSMHSTNYSCAPIAKTIRYASVNAFNELPVTEVDDLQSLGFVLLESYYGFNQSPLNGTTSEKSKLDVINNAEQGKYGNLFQEYFKIISGLKNGDDMYNDILDYCV